MGQKDSDENLIDKIMKIAGVLQNIFSVIPLVAMCFIVLASVIMRYALKIPFTWGEEAARYLMIFAAMLAIGMGVRERSHLGVTVFTNLLRGRLQKVVNGFARVVSLAIYMVLTYLSWEFITAQYKFGQLSAALKLPMYLVYSMMLLGFGFSCIETVYLIWKEYVQKDSDDAGKETV